MLVNSTFPRRGARTAARAAARRARLRRKRSRARSPGAYFHACSTATRTRYGRIRPKRSIKAITRADVVEFHQRYFKPGRALVTVVGDITPAAIRPVIEKGLAGWAPGGEKPAFSYPPAAGGEGDDDLSRRQTRRRAVDVRHRPAGAASHHTRLLRAAGDEHDSRRHVPVAPQRQHPRGKGLQLRRQLVASALARGPARSARAATSSATRPTRRSWSS